MGGKSSRDHKASSGQRKARRRKELVRRLSYKINRWKRYQKEIETEVRKGNVSRWDTSGLEKYKAFLEGLAK